MRDAQSILGQLVGGAGADGITYDDAIRQLGFTSDALIDDVVNALGSGQGNTLFKVIDNVVTGGHDPRRFVTDLLERLRDLIVLAAAPDAAEHGLVDAPSDRLQTLKEQAELLGLPALSRAADTVSDGLTVLRGATAPRLQLELLAARLLLPGGEAGVAQLAARVDALERRPAGAAVAATHNTVIVPTAAPAAAPEKPAAVKPRKLSEVAPSTAAKPAEETAAVPAPATEEPSAPAATAAAPTAPAATGPALDIESVRTLWPAVLEALKALPNGGRTTWTVFAESAPTGLNGDALVVALKQQGSYTVARSRNLDDVLKQAAVQVLHRDVQIELILDHGVTVAAPKAEPAKEAPAKPKESPRKKAEARVATEKKPDPINDVADPQHDADAEDEVRGIELARQALGGVVLEEVE